MRTMATINVNWSRLHEQGIAAPALVKHLQTWEKAGYKVYCQVQDQKDLTVLQQMTAPPPQTLPRVDVYPLICLFLLGSITTLITVGWLGLLR